MRLISAIEPKTSTLKERIATAIQAKTSIFSLQALTRLFSLMRVNH
jgi:hypothetical protein